MRLGSLGLIIGVLANPESVGLTKLPYSSTGIIVVRPGRAYNVLITPLTLPASKSDHSILFPFV